MEEDKSLSLTSDTVNYAEDTNHGWQKVTYAKKQRKNQAKKAASDLPHVLPNGSAPAVDKGSVFKGLEKHAEERRRKLEAQRAAAVFDDDDEIPRRSRHNRDGDDDEDDFSSDADARENAVDVSKKEKPKKVKKPKVTVAEAASKIDADDLAIFLASITVYFAFLRSFSDFFIVVWWNLGNLLNFWFIHVGIL